MAPAERDAFLAEPRIAKLAYLLEDGSPTIVPVWFEWDGAEARVFTSSRSAKISHLRRDARVALTVETVTGEPEAWVTLEGTVAIEQGGWALAKRLTPRYYARERSAEALDAWNRVADDWVVLRITPRRIRSLSPA